MEDKPRGHDRFSHQKQITLRIKIDVPPSQFLMLFVVVLYLYQISYSPKLKLNSITWPNWITRCTKNQKSNYSILIFSESFNVRTKQVFDLKGILWWKKKKMFAVALDPIQQKLGAECPFPAKMVDWAQNKVVINNINIINIVIMKISTWI